MLRSFSKVAFLFLIVETINLFNLINGQSVPFNQIGCTFDQFNNLCNWNALKSQYVSNWQSKQFSARTVNFTGALNPVNNVGRFIQIYNTTGKYSSPATGALQSPLISPINTQMCFSFYYYIHGVDANRIELYLSSQTIWTRHFPAGDMWHRAMINIPLQQTQFSLKFLIYSGGGAVALDQFNPILGPCPMSEVCDFESGLCGWTLNMNGGGSFAFKLVQAMSSSWQSSTDHSTETQFGHFVEANSGNTNEVATLMSQQFPSSYGYQCLQFWYRRYTSTENSLVVSQDTNNGITNKVTQIWVSDMTFPKQTWHRASISLPLTRSFPYKIAFRATHKVTGNSPIDIDDISLKPLACPPVINCDFNVDMCGWSRDPTTQWIWDHGFGRVEDGKAMKFTYPPRDRQSPADGMFMYTDFSRMPPSSKYTMILNSEFVPPTSGSCFSFYFVPMTFDNTRNSFNVILKDNSDAPINTVWTYPGKSTSGVFMTPWTIIRINIQTQKAFRISLQVMSTNPSTYLAIDDITYTTGLCNGQIVGSTLAPINTGLNLNCNFDSNNFCNWINQAAPNPWSMYNPTVALLPMMPNVDHTKQSVYGRYIYVIHNVNSGTPNKMAFMSAGENAVKTYRGYVCVSLWYYMRTNSVAHFNVTIQQPQVPITRVSRFNDHGEKWNLLRFDTFEQGNGYQFMISAMVANGIVAIDDIQVINQQCGALKANVFQCTFEDNHICGFTPAYTNTQASWQLYNGTGTYIKTFDHTLKTLGGHYYALDFSRYNGGGVTYTYRVVSEKFPPTKGACVTFSYYMRGLTQKEFLNFYIKKENDFSLINLNPLWYARGEMGPFWYNHRMTINSTLSWQIVFGAVASHTRDGLIAIDDVMVEIDKTCPMKGRCDFENGDTCMWESILPSQAAIGQEQKLRWSNVNIGQPVKNGILMKTDFTWTVHSPAHGFSSAYPPVDHTLKQRTGSYLLLRTEFPRKIYDRAVLMSDRYDINPNNRSFCLKFFYYLKNTQQFYVYSKLEVFQSENYTIVKKIGQLSISPNNNWIQFNVTAKPDNISSTEMWFYLVGTVGTPGSYIGVDDISIDQGDCGVPSKMFKCTETEFIPSSKVCDNKRDCSNGLDEISCGDCNFVNKQDCGYKHSYNGNQQDTNLYQWRFGNSTTALRIGPDGSSGFVIASRAKTTSDFGRADLYSPQINGAASGCYVQFRYNIFGAGLNFGVKKVLSHLSVILNRNGFEQTEIWNSDVLNPIQNRWLVGNAYLKRMNYSFGLIFRATDNSVTTSTYVGLSRIQLIGCEMRKPSLACPSSYGFQCRNRVCVSKFFRCDFNDDCGDGSDELDCGTFTFRYNFENGYGNWGKNRTDKWALASGGQSLLNGPTRDHTKGIARGIFLYLRSTSPLGPTQATIDGPIFQPDQGCYMVFWLDMEGSGAGKGYISILAQNLRTYAVSIVYRTQIYQFPNNMFGYTRHIVEFTNQRDKFKVFIQGYLEKYDQTVVIPNYLAVDDITFSSKCVQPGFIGTGTPPPLRTTPSPCPLGQFACKAPFECIDKSLVCNFNNDCADSSDELNCGTCNFDTGSYCGWTNIGQGKQQWSIQPAKKFALRNIPKIDGKSCSNCSFLIIDTSRGGTFNLPAVISTPILGPTGPNCKMVFAYHQSFLSVGSQVGLTVTLHKPSGFSWNKQLFTIRRPFPTWTNFSVNIGSLPAGYQIQIAGMGVTTASTLPYADMEIDEIKFIDCGSTSTASNSLSCNFENGFCGWFDFNRYTDNQIDWVRTRLSQVDPGYDHTSQIRPRPSSSGYWLYTKRMPTAIGNNTATLMTVAQQPASGPKCLTFWYHMFGRDAANFSLYNNSQKSVVGGNLLWIKKLPQSNNWMRAQVTIQSQASPYYLMFRASLQARSRDTIGLDDISFTNGVCPPAQECDFEVDFCGWNYTNGDFIRQTAAQSLLPPIDHTMKTKFGNYIKVSNPNKIVYLSKTITKVTSLNFNRPSVPQPMCIKFWYYFAGSLDSNNFLRITTNLKSNPRLSGNIWTRTSLIMSQLSLSQQWVYGRVNFKAASNDQIQINARITSTTSVIAVDDVLIQTQACEQPGWCDFESDFCGWTNAPPTTNRKRVLWQRNRGETESEASGPDYDHTTGTDEGWYAYVPLDTQRDGAAVLQSEILNYGPTVCLQFYYHMLAENILLTPKLIISYLSPGRANPTWVQNITDNRIDRWIKFQVTINNVPPNIRIALKTIEGSVSRADVAIDDIQVKSGSCAVAFLTTPRTPLSTRIIPAAEQQWDCSFETPNCNWVFDPNWVKTYWFRNSSQYGPRIDHTFKTANGHYLLYASKPNAPNPATLMSNTITTTTNGLHCFSFWYNVDSESYYNFSIGYIIPSYPNVNYILYLGSQAITSSSWKLVHTQVPIVQNMKIVIKFYHNTPFVGGFAIDDIKLTPGVCTSLYGSSCDFSQGFCGYQAQRFAPPGSAGIGIIYNSQMSGSYNFPIPVKDHTSGSSSGKYYLFANKPADPNGVYRSNLIINSLPSTGFRSSCLKFWYQISSNFSSNFYIYVAPINQMVYRSPLWVSTYSHYTTWTMGQLTVNALYPHKIVFSFAQMKNVNSYIALDDISLTNGRCEPPISCDYDTDMCSWHDVTGSVANWNWGRYTGPPPINTAWPGPRFDHTLNRNGGSYLYLTAFRANGMRDRVAVIESMPVTSTLSTSNCLSYWTQLKGTDTSIQVLLVRNGKNIDPNTRMVSLGYSTNGTKSIWTKVNINIDPILLKNATEFSIRIRGKINNPQSFIALDDVKLSNFACAASSQFICTDGTQLNISQVCNFVKDCPHSNDDELNCGACNFEKDMCGWGNKIKTGEQWIKKSAFNISKPIGPRVDGTNNKTGNYLIIDPRYTGFASPIASIQSTSTVINRLKRAYQTCQMTFHYYMTTVTNSYFNVLINSGISSSNIIFRLRGDQGPQWKTATVNIYEQRAPFNVEIRGYYPGQAGIIAIDDISFQNCAPPAPTKTVCSQDQIKCPSNNVCINKYLLCDGMNDCGDSSDESYANCKKMLVPKCNFDVRNGVCNWTKEKDQGSNAVWSYSTSASRNSQQFLLTGPVSDHTYRRLGIGTFLVLRGQPKDFGKKSRLITPMVKANTGQTCALRLFYYMFGNSSQMGSLSVYTRFADITVKTNNVLFTKSGNVGQQWLRVVTSVTDQRPFQFVIEGQVGRGILADIAIDDVSFSEGCIRSNQKPFTTTTGKPILPPKTVRPGSSQKPGKTVSGTYGKPTKPSIGNTGPKKAGSNTGGIVAGVLVPILVIAAIVGVWYYRRYFVHRHDEDRIAFTNAVYDQTNMVETSIDENHDKGFYPEKQEKKQNGHENHNDKL